MNEQANKRLGTVLALIGTVFAAAIIVCLALLFRPEHTTVGKVSKGLISEGATVEVVGYYYNVHNRGWALAEERDGTWVRVQGGEKERIREGSRFSITGTVRFNRKYGWVIVNPKFRALPPLKRAEAQPSKIVDKA